MSRHHDLPEPWDDDPDEGQKPGMFRSYWTLGFFCVCVAGALYLIYRGVDAAWSILFG